MDLFAPTSAAGEELLSVGDLAQQIKSVLESDPLLSDIAVRGEISNFNAHGSGHLYFTLKDSDAQIRCCMWRSGSGRLAFRPANGNRVVAIGHVEFYQVRGEVSFIVEALRFDGQGALLEAFEQLKRELAGEGLFAPERKRALPPLPRHIGLITSPTGAAAHDVISIIRRRWPVARILLIPALVQGFSAAPDLVRALGWASAVAELDLLIVARGGGSAEDLWCFNDEELARAAAQFPKPLISAVGHETDFTILDFVADLRAPTPSAAAELATPDIRELHAAVNGLRWRLYNAAAGEVRLARQRFESLRRSRALGDPRERLAQSREEVAQLRRRALSAFARHVKIERQNVAARRAHLRALDPRRVLERGYAWLRDKATGRVITSAAQVQPGMEYVLQLHDGVATVRAMSQGGVPMDG